MLEQLGAFNPLVILKQYGWYIVFTLLAAALIEKNFLSPYLRNQRREQSLREATKPERVSLLNTDREMVRQRQQEQALQRSKEAKEAAQAKKLADMEAKRIARPHEEKRGQKLGDGSSTNTNTTCPAPGSGGYSAMDPSSGHTAGYRSTRRNPRRS